MFRHQALKGPKLNVDRLLLIKMMPALSLMQKASKRTQLYNLSHSITQNGLCREADEEKRKLREHPVQAAVLPTIVLPLKESRTMVILLPDNTLHLKLLETKNKKSALQSKH